MEQATTAKIASEALKPVSALIDALLGPKLQRIRKWAEKRELSSRLGSSVIDVLLEEYLRRVLRRICGITTIVFPQQILPLTAIYEPLILVSRYGDSEEDSRTTLNIETLELGQNYLIVDSAGMGKSTFAKHFVLEILHATNKIPVFLELRRIGDSESLLKKIAAEIDLSGKDIDEELLRMLLEDGNFILVLDGFDEVPPQYRSTIGQQISELAVQCDKNSVILTARPEVTLPDLPNSQIFEIKPLTRPQAEALILRYDAVADIEVGKNLLTLLDSIPKPFLETPLLIVLLYRTYGFNQSIATRISSFYDEVFNALYKGHDLSKAGFARPKSSQLDSQDFRRLLRGFAFLLTARQKDNLNTESEALEFISEATTLTSTSPHSSTSFLQDLLLAVPLLIKDGTDYRFIHKSMREFFTAEFLAYQSNNEQIIGGIRDGHLYNSFLSPFEYLSDIDPRLFQRLIVSPVAQQVLDDENPIENPYIRSIGFLMTARFGLWPHDIYGPDSDRDIPLPRGFNEIWYFYGDLKGERYIVGITIRNALRLPTSVWNAITIHIPTTNTSRSHSGYDFDSLENNIPKERWLGLDEEGVLKTANHPAIVGIFKTLLINYPFTVEAMVRNKPQLRVISNTRCEKVIDQIERETQTQGWLKTLITGSGQSPRKKKARKVVKDLRGSK